MFCSWCTTKARARQITCVIRSSSPLAETRSDGVCFHHPMSTPSCSKCGAGLPPEVKFCRQCGAAVSSSNSDFFESPTALLSPPTDDVSTQRLYSRHTTPGPELPGISPPPAINATSGQPVSIRTRKRKWPLALLLLAGVLIVAIVIVCVALLRPGRQIASSADNASFVYPNSQTILDAATDGGRVIQLQTGDSSDQVVAWYTANLKPTKTIRLPVSTTVLKNQNVTVTIVGEEGKTTVLIKTASP